MPATPIPAANEPAPDDADDGSRLPDYAVLLRATHRAFGRELRRAASALPLGPRDRVLDVPCGDGFYTARLARRLAPQGKVVAADLSDAFLAAARRRVHEGRRLPPSVRRRLVRRPDAELTFLTTLFLARK